MKMLKELQDVTKEYNHKTWLIYRSTRMVSRQENPLVNSLKKTLMIMYKYMSYLFKLHDYITLYDMYCGTYVTIC